MKAYVRGVDGLRALAVTAVLLFHAFPTLIRGGFIGVDVFFVISGYVISRTYFEDLCAKRVSLGTFFRKRVRRLAPIYLVVLLATTIAAFAILIPIHLRKFAESLVAQPFYLQNLVFWDHGDYFELALTKPLLHTWSLAVEEQFYLSYALLIVAARRAPRLALPALGGAIALSLGLGWVLSTVSPKTAFYMLPPRVWEMALGVIVALVANKMTHPRWAHALYPGLLLILWSIARFDEHASFPGAQSIAACVGTALALASFSTTSSGVALRALGHRVPVYVGKLSYSLYLWHWPLIALLATYLNRSLTLAEGAAAIAATFVVSHFGFEYLETPIRTQRVLASDRRLLVLAGGAGVFTIAVALVFIFTDGATFRYPPPIARLYLAQEERSPFRCPRLGRLAHPNDEMCKINSIEDATNVLVLGDSHADVLDEVIADVAASEGMGAFLTRRDCKLYDFGDPSRPDCPLTVLARLGADIRARNIKYVFTMAFTQKEFHEQARLTSNATTLLASIDRLWIMQVVPNDDAFNPEIRVRLMLANQPARQYTLSQYRTDNAASIDALRGIALADPRVTILDPSLLLCGSGVCDRETGGVSNYFDSHHLSPTGAARLAPMFRAALESVRTAPQPIN